MTDLLRFIGLVWGYLILAALWAGMVGYLVWKGDDL